MELKNRAKKRLLRSVQKLSPVRDVQDGVIITKDGRFIKLLEFEPINYSLKSPAEKEAIAERFAYAVRTMPESVQFKAVSREADGNTVIENLKDRLKKELRKEVRNIIEDEIEFISQIASSGVSRRFFVCFEHEKRDSGLSVISLERRSDFNRIKSDLEYTARTIITSLAECGNRCISPSVADDGWVLAALYHIFCAAQSYAYDFSEKEFDVVARYIAGQGIDSKENLIIPANDIICPTVVDSKGARYIMVDGLYMMFCYIPSSSYPLQVFPGWAGVLINMGAGIDIDIFIKKQSPSWTQTKLTYGLNAQESRLRNENSNSSERARLELKIASGKFLQDGLSDGDDFMYMATLITITAPSYKALATRFHEVKDYCLRKNLKISVCNFRQKDALLSSLPICKLNNAIYERAKRNILTSGFGDAYPFVSYELTDEKGVLLGLNADNGSMVVLDNFDRTKYPNGNMLITGSSGGGKSYLLQTLALRYCALGIPVYAVLALKGHEWERGCRAAGGTFIRLASGSDCNINILDIRPVDPRSNNSILGFTSNESRLFKKIQTVHAFISLIIPKTSNVEDNIIDKALIKTYADFDITEDNESLFNSDGTIKTMPTLKEFYYNLPDIDDAKNIKAALERFVTGSAKIFSHPTNVDLNNPYTIIDVSTLSSDLLPLGMFIANDIIDDKVKEDVTKKKVSIKDELWTLIGHGASKKAASSVLEEFKAIRGYGGICIAATQDLNDFYTFNDGQYGKGILNSSEIRFLLKASDDEMKEQKDKLKLSDTEVLGIINAQRGHGLLVTGSTHVFVDVKASRYQHNLITTDREELEKLAKERSGYINGI